MNPDLQNKIDDGINTDAQIGSVFEKANLYSNCRNGKQLCANFVEWERSYFGYIEGYERCQSILQPEIQSLNDEIEMLRRYGNKDCTAMADEALSQQKKEVSE